MFYIFLFGTEIICPSYPLSGQFFSKWFPKLELSDKGNIMPTMDRQAAYEEVLDELDDLTDNSDLNDE